MLRKLVRLLFLAPVYPEILIHYK